jgi:hypothetical protein
MSHTHAGTLTENRMTVVRGWFGGQTFPELPTTEQLSADLVHALKVNVAMTSKVRALLWLLITTKSRTMLRVLARWLRKLCVALCVWAAFTLPVASQLFSFLNFFTARRC